MVTLPEFLAEPLSELMILLAVSAGPAVDGGPRFACPLPTDKLRVNSWFGNRRDPFTRRAAFHEGIDLVTSIFRPVRAAAAGTVIYADTKNAYGRLVMIDHGDGWRTHYAHLRSIRVEVGDRVAAWAQIGRLGRSGAATRPLLHFEIHKDGAPVDPLPHLVLTCALEPPNWVRDGQKSGHEPSPDLPLSVE